MYSLTKDYVLALITTSYGFLKLRQNLFIENSLRNSILKDNNENINKWFCDTNNSNSKFANRKLTSHITKVPTLNKLYTYCNPSAVSIDTAKQYLVDILKSLGINNQNNPIIYEKNGSFIIKIKIPKIYNVNFLLNGILKVINEKVLPSQSSTTINISKWKSFENIDGKKINIEFDDILNSKGYLNVFIPKDENELTELEFIRPSKQLTIKDIEALKTGLLLSQNSENKIIQNNLNQWDAHYIMSTIFDRIDNFFNFDPFMESGFHINTYGSNDIHQIFNLESNTTRFPMKNINYSISNQLNDKFNQNKSESLKMNEMEAISTLEELGVQVYIDQDYKSEMINEKKKEIDLEDSNQWDNLAGYEHVKTQIEKHILLHIKYPEILNKIVNGTRKQDNSSNRPKLILFEGPPGTGKTTSARIISKVAKIPLLYVSLENIISKWYGESEQKLAQVFNLAKQFDNGCIIFIDEIDTLASSRDNTFNMHEGSKRILSVLLRKLDGFDTTKDKILLICATNRRNDIDQAFINRIDSTIYFHLPDEKERKAIFQQYAKHLNDEQLSELSKLSNKLSGRAIRHVCLEAEREWAANILKKGDQEKKAQEIELPLYDIYIDCLKKKKTNISKVPI
ncbi:AAA family protein [Cryptosporidium andersoni]|uniref:AAA family protein n=1 Tax=Cryptosporidium andersoni TaxID=117008 RepID=A0A1J4MA87_9CRYT|nr:AAA family protein [Cryptosporidium andersoni]